AQSIAPQCIELELHLAVLAHFFVAGSEVTMPKQGHLFLEWARRAHHAVNPPEGQTACFKYGCATPVEPTIGDGLEWPHTTWLNLDTHGVASELGLRGRRWARIGRCQEAIIPKARFFEGWQGTVINAGVIYDASDS